MNTYEKLTKYLKHGLHVMVRSGNHDLYEVISPMKDEDGDYRRSSYYLNTQRAKDSIGSFPGYSKLEEKCKDDAWIILEAFHLPHELYAPGEKVVHEELGVGFATEITERGLYIVKFPDDKYFQVAYHSLKPYFEDAKIEAVIVVDGKEYSTSTIKKALQEYCK